MTRGAEVGQAARALTTHLLSARSVLFPTSMMMTSLPLSVLTSSIHFDVCWNELMSVWRGEKQSGGKLKMVVCAVCDDIRHADTSPVTNKTINLSSGV